jgi:uncharacterized membrane protein
VALTRSGNQPLPTGAARAWMRLVLTAFYLVAGVLHLRLTNGFAAIVPAFVPEPHRVVLLTGWCEILGAAALQVRRLRHLAGIMLAIYAVCVFPANVNQAVNHIPVDGRVLGWGYHAIRFALEPVLIWWTLWCSAVIDWPFGSVPRRRH